jgi:palmitoyltransferase
LKWLNAKTYDEQWQAIHYGAFSGNLDALYKLLEAGADFKTLNANGLNVMHVAAQGD